VVATAANGKEAMEALKKHKVDVMTLDIHMPEMDGISYLQKNMNSLHPPVLMLSSVNRENASTALKSIELGASDYVEKPTMANLMERGDEIRSKLKTALLLKNVKAMQSLDAAFKRDFRITDPERKLRVIFSQIGDKKKMAFFLKNLNHQDPGTIFVFEGASEAILPFAKEMEKARGQKIKLDQFTMAPGEIGFAELDSVKAQLQQWLKERKTSVLVTGVPTKKVSDFILAQGSLHLCLEDLGSYTAVEQKLLKDVSSSIAPVTSYLSISEEFLG